METALSLLVLAAMALVGGAFVLWRKGGSAKRIGLMLFLALVMIVNVGIWTVPDSSGQAPLERELR